METRNPKSEPTLGVRSNPARVSKTKSVTSPVKQYRMKRYRNGLLNLEQTPAHLVATVKMNAASPLLRPPAEIRNQIWSYACGGQSVMLPARWLTTEEGGAVRFLNIEELDLNENNFEKTKVEVLRRRAIRMPSAFHLPRVCRQIYAETALISYKANAFVCDEPTISGKHPMARLMAAQRKAIATIEPMPEVLCLMVILHSKTHEGIMNVLPNVRKLSITSIAMRYVQAYTLWCTSTHDEKYAWNQDHWRAWVVRNLKYWKKGHADVVLED